MAKNEGKAMADEELPADEQDANDKAEEVEEEEDERGAKPAYHPAVAVAPSTGFFSVYKSGQGYWVRMGTAAGAALIVLVTALFMYERLTAAFSGSAASKTKWLTIGMDTWIMMGIIALFVLAIGVWVYRLLNKPTVADFLIATESEMKKVNWTTKKELIGSTKVVIFFMFLLTLILFTIDYIFMTFFRLIGVLG